MINIKSKRMKIVKEIGCLLICLVIFTPLFVSAKIEVVLDINDSFKIGDDPYFNYSISSDILQQINFQPYISCFDFPLKLLVDKIINLTPTIPYYNNYQVGFLIDDSIEPQNCTAYIQILSPVQQRTEKTFEIKTNPSFSFDILLDKKVFVKNEEIKINYDSEVPEPIITATLTFPDNTQQQITLPTSIKAEQIGTYNLEVIASKEGYKIITNNIQFGIIEKEANILYTEQIEGRDILKDKSNWLPILIASVISVIVIIIGIIILKRNRQKFIKKKI